MPELRARQKMFYGHAALHKGALDERVLMTLHVALTHRTAYHYDRAIGMAPQVIRLRPAPHCRTPILSYSLNLEPKLHFLNWQQDPFANYCARVVLPEKTDRFVVTVDLVADMGVINPFDFYVEDSAKDWPFPYDPELKVELGQYLEPLPATPLLKKFLASIPSKKEGTIDFLTELNRRVRNEVNYCVRLEPGIQTPEETLTKASGSCRDSGWLLVQVLRHIGFAARFVSGYLIQLRPDVKPLDGGAAGAEADFTDLHAWAEVYLPGAGWIGLDPTSGLLAGEGHIPLAATPQPSSAAPISGAHEPAEVTFSFDMKVERILESPRCRRHAAGQCRRAPQHGRRADVRVHRRHGQRRVEDRCRRSHKARLRRRFGAPLAATLCAWRPAALRPGQVVSRRAAAALGLRALLAPRRAAAVERSEPHRQ
jgi:transglutaminase-like putative cysteine protease